MQTGSALDAKIKVVKIEAESNTLARCKAMGEEEEEEAGEAAVAASATVANSAALSCELVSWW